MFLRYPMILMNLHKKLLYYCNNKQKKHQINKEKSINSTFLDN